METYSVASNIDAWCTKCKKESRHIIVALMNNLPKRVKCKDCSGEHNFRGKPETKKTGGPKKISTKAKSESAKLNEYHSRIKDRDLAEAAKYLITGNYLKDALIHHSNFGIGVVLSINQETKIDVIFKDGTKTLIQNHINIQVEI